MTDVAIVRARVFEAGRAEERKAIVEWLRSGGLTAGRVSPDDDVIVAVAMVAADAIERGDHRLFPPKKATA